MAKFPINNKSDSTIAKKIKSLNLTQSTRAVSPYTTGHGILNNPEYMPPVRRR